MTQPLSPEELGALFQAIDDEPTGKLSELAKIAGLSLAEDYIGVDLSNDDLSNDNLNGANLSNSNLSGANLSNSDLSNSNLSEANLSEANLSGANLSGANLNGANLNGANLSGATWVDPDLAKVIAESSSQVSLHHIAANQILDTPSHVRNDRTTKYPKTKELVIQNLPVPLLQGKHLQQRDSVTRETVYTANRLCYIENTIDNTETPLGEEFDLIQSYPEDISEDREFLELIRCSVFDYLILYEIRLLHPWFRLSLLFHLLKLTVAHKYENWYTPEIIVQIESILNSYTSRSYSLN